MGSHDSGPPSQFPDSLHAMARYLHALSKFLNYLIEIICLLEISYKANKCRFFFLSFYFIYLFIWWVEIKSPQCDYIGYLRLFCMVAILCFVNFLKTEYIISANENV